MKDIRPCAKKNTSELSLEWDRLAEERHRQISSGEDLSFEHVLVPTILQLFNVADTKLVLDVGSGTGDFTARLAQMVTRVIGVEPSGASIAVARTGCVGTSNVRFIQATLEQSAKVLQENPPTAAVASMTLMTVPNLTSFAEALGALLPNKAKFVATLSHPCFWPRYWCYEDEDWFNYNRETFIEAPFVISRCRTHIKTTHIHRSLEQYVRVFASAGFALEALAEPIPSPQIQKLYPQPWQFPRFVGMRWVKTV